jgi:hypothetical protein
VFLFFFLELNFPILSHVDQPFEAEKSEPFSGSVKGTAIQRLLFLGRAMLCSVFLFQGIYFQDAMVFYFLCVHFGPGAWGWDPWPVRWRWPSTTQQKGSERESIFVFFFSFWVFVFRGGRTVF